MKKASNWILSFALIASTSVLAAEPKLPAPIEALQKQGFELKGEFKAPGNLQGYAMQYQGQGTTVYLTPDKQHAIMGNLVDAAGKNLSDEQVEKWVYAPMAKEMWQKLEKNRWIAAGKADAPHIVYAFADPYCPYCTQFWQKAQPWLKSGKVQLRVLMVGMLRPDSAQKAAAIMMAKDPAKTLADYENSQGKMELAVPAAITPQITEALKSNLALMDELGGSATPSIYYLNKEGRLQQHQGLPDDEALQAIMGDKP
ncbi:thiol:disulfide interchange protein DsbG [Enterobacteriaceae bacterium H20N1]|uniref:Thiol:disulfide interchange protein n=1 Tax=Dryocola boscaweniae TaxID=2925397 RepID=A0A9X2WAB9_9ENTR|nr:thiol:disulfide interchange protein DsbG [Dryocola boscaweniae]MCT4703830.1 thiol:disulfide interchange protein DsbG [Dryocola boscaweniae]MCT4717007.1 thiol:disulfide interchange protein DsbG [Dryocola boscaweniae]MCT4720998.1 thiol:disulfide interchange protein DsbG [Dryocola boscaweniae]